MRARVSLSVICILLIAPSALADFVGVTTVNKDDPDTDFQCTQGNGAFVPGPLTVCNVSALFDDPSDRLLSANVDLQVYNGQNPDVFFQHPFNFTSTSPTCAAIRAFPDLICDSFITIGLKCGPAPPAHDGTAPGGDFDPGEFQFNGHVIGFWFNSDEDNGQGDAGNYPDLQVLFLQSSVAQGLSLSGLMVKIFWEDQDTGDVIAELDIPVECVAVGGCQDPEDCDDSNACTDDACTENGCTNDPINCDDGNDCTDDDCDPDAGCTHTPNNDPCDDGDECTENDQCGEDGCVHGGGPTDCNDGNACTDDGCDSDTGCTHEDIDCDDGISCTEDSCDSRSGCVNRPNEALCDDDGNECTDVDCDPDIGCVHLPNNNICDDGDACTENDTCGEDGCVHGTPVQCPEGQVCDPANGKCIEADDPCECVNSRVTLCHIPPGNPGNAHTITVGCNALERHLAHGDHCGPCEDGDG